jgi:hypothetical protein
MIETKQNNFLKNLDKFGSTVSFNIKGDKNVKSYIGSFFTISFYLLYIAMLLFNFYSFLNDKSPQINILARYKENSTILQDENFLNMTFAIKSRTDGLKLILENSSFYQATENQSSSIDQVGIMENCTIRQRSQTLESRQYYKTHKDFLYCSNIYKKAYLGGDLSQSSDNSIYGAINFDLCKSIDCNQDMELALHEYKIALTLDNFYTCFNITEGFKPFLQVQIFEFDFRSDYFVEINVKRNIMSTNPNILFNFKDNVIIYNNQFDATILPTTRPSNSKLMTIKFKITLDNIETVSVRNYMTLNTLFANTLSTMTAINAIIKIIHDITTYGNAERLFINNLYHINPDCVTKKNTPLQNLQSDKELSSERKEIVSTVLLVLEKKKIKKSRGIFWHDLLFLPTKSQSIRRQLSGLKLLKYDLDMVNILRKLIEYETVKKILFSELQLDTISIMSGRVIDNEKDVDKYVKYLESKLYCSKGIDEKAIDGLKSSIDPIDQRIYQNFINLIEQIE